MRKTIIASRCQLPALPAISAATSSVAYQHHTRPAAARQRGRAGRAITASCGSS